MSICQRLSKDGLKHRAPDRPPSSEGRAKILITPYYVQPRVALLHLRRAAVKQQHPSPPLPIQKHWECESTMTLKRAYPSECQRVQGAFKDSMIHSILQFTLLIAFRCVLHRCE